MKLHVFQNTVYNAYWHYGLLPGIPVFFQNYNFLVIFFISWWFRDFKILCIYQILDYIVKRTFAAVSWNYLCICVGSAAQIYISLYTCVCDPVDTCWNKYQCDITVYYTKSIGIDHLCFFKSYYRNVWFV